MTFEEKYALVSEEYKTAREIGLPAATLGAMVRRGLVEATATSPKQYRRVGSSAARIYQLLEDNKDDYDIYFTLRKSSERLGMLCSFKNNIVFDCWDRPYDLTDVNLIEFKTKSYFI